MKRTIPIFAAFCLSSSALWSQNVPDKISYQGQVVDASGVGLGTTTPVNRKVIFRIFDAATAGNRLWSEEQTVTISGGDFSVMLGQGQAASYNGSAENPKPSLLAVFGGTDRYLEVVVDNGDGVLNTSDTPITPRQRLTSTAFAVRAATADAVTANADLSLKDGNSGLGWYGTGRLFNGINVDGAVLYGNSGGVLGSKQGSTETAAIRWNGSGKVAIGGSAPNSSYALDVTGAIHGSSDLVLDGRLGLSTTAPMARIGIRSGYQGGGTDGGGAGSLAALSFEYASGGYRHFIRSRHAIGSVNGNALDIFLNNSDSVGSTAPGTGNVLGLTVDGNGVGIGTSIPDAKLDVRGCAIIHQDGTLGPPAYGRVGGVGMRLVLFPGSDSTTPYGFGINGGELYGLVPATSSFKWYSGLNTTSLMALDSTGNLGLSGGITASGNVTADRDISAGGYIRATGDITARGKSVPVAEENLRIVRGTVNMDGTKKVGSGFTATRTGTGQYTIQYDSGFTSEPSVVVTEAGNNSGWVVFIATVDSNESSVKVVIRDSVGALGNYPFTFIAAGPR